MQIRVFRYLLVGLLSVNCSQAVDLHPDIGVPRGTYLLVVESTAQEAVTHRICYRVLSVCR